MKRILTTTILLGRRGKKESVHSLSTKTFEFGDKGTADFYEKEGLEKDLELNNGKMKIDEVHKCKTTKGLRTKSSKQRYDENMDTENMTSKTDLAPCLIKKSGSGKKTNEICLELSEDQTSPTTEHTLKPRKRKERLDSEGSIKQENKVIRSNSEERSDGVENKDKDANMRRVSSHEDFSRVRVLQEINSQSSGLPDENEGLERAFKRNGFCMEEMFHNAEELEHERIRSCERFSRAVAPPRGRRNFPRKRIKGSKKKFEFGEPSHVKKDVPKEGTLIREAAMKLTERDSSPSPEESSSPPALDISSLHRQMEGSEPITSRGKVMSPEDEPESPSLEVLISPRNSLVMRLLNSDPSVPPSPPREHNIRHGKYDSQERKLTKQINSIKRNLKRYEEGFQEEFGYRPSQADKMANKDIKKMCSDLNKLRSQLTQFREESMNDPIPAPKHLSFLTCLESGSQQNVTPNVSKHQKSNKTMEEVLQEVEKRLQEKRAQSGRSSEISEMNRGDLLEEKLAVQKALLHLENVFGRPVTKEDRDLVRPLYQRYRSLKRLVIRSTGGKLNNSTGELATILEHETMEFTNSPSTSFDLGEGTLSAPEGLNIPLATETGSLKVQQSDESHNSSSSSDSLGENLHALPLSQLLEQQKTAREEKKKLRRSLKEFDESFQSVAGRRAQKQDRIIVEGIYVNYKQVKAKLRLLDALVAKKSCVKRNSC
ncbi:hypothetical protein RUM44_013545 [Polyplax serrata]|uniref:FAM13A-like domain-containing protein n=1 Tax=Polyplax serrata TaxID=468196 RepID=A0ABR1BET2_POLSC